MPILSLDNIENVQRFLYTFVPYNLRIQHLGALPNGGSVPNYKVPLLAKGTSSKTHSRHYIMTIIKHFKPMSLGAIAVLFLSACSSQPRQVQATIPLVPPKAISGQEIGQQHWQALESNETSLIDHQGQRILVGEKFTSALGLTCRKLTVTEDNQPPSERIACAQMTTDEQGQSVSQWFLTKQIVHSATAVEIN
jgi:hypothetical protein